MLCIGDLIVSVVSNERQAKREKSMYFLLTLYRFLPILRQYACSCLDLYKYGSTNSGVPDASRVRAGAVGMSGGDACVAQAHPGSFPVCTPFLVEHTNILASHPSDDPDEKGKLPQNIDLE